MYSYIEFLTPFSVTSWCIRMCAFFCFLFFLASNYPLFPDTVELLRGSDVSCLPVHRFFFTLKKYQPDGFKKCQLYLIYYLKLKYHCKMPLILLTAWNYTYHFRCTKNCVFHHCIKQKPTENLSCFKINLSE